MKLLLDTHLLLWAAFEPAKLPQAARAMMEDPDAELWFSVISIWEVAIKRGRGRSEFQTDPGVLRHGLVTELYIEMPITGSHVEAVARLPNLHKDPFDRMLVAQAIAEHALLVTADKQVAAYPGPIRKV